MKTKLTMLLSALLITITSFAYSGPNPHVDKLWARQAEKGNTTAIYFDIYNKSNVDEELLGANTDVAEMTEIHKTVTENGVSQMVRIDRLVIPADQSVKFQPKGMHIMLMGLKQKLNPGDELYLKLIFKNAGTQTFKVIVK